MNRETNSPNNKNKSKSNVKAEESQHLSRDGLVFSMTYYNLNDYSKQAFSKQNLKELFLKLRYFEELSRSGVAKMPKMKKEKKGTDADKRINGAKPEYLVGTSNHHIAISEKFRIFGFLSGRIFYITHIDPEHRMQA